MADVEGFAKAIVGLIDTVGKPIIDKLPSPLDWLFAGVVGFIKALIERLFG
ncbi:unnamed protein product [marine sediment metagenome]|uniref:Uncharacterized protein n=1 Tax=marine sediment metagenome TaxID=412755 RepID=X1BY14_9ZZZZ